MAQVGNVRVCRVSSGDTTSSLQAEELAKKRKQELIEQVRLYHPCRPAHRYLRGPNLLLVRATAICVLSSITGCEVQSAANRLVWVGCTAVKWNTASVDAKHVTRMARWPLHRAGDSGCQGQEGASEEDRRIGPGEVRAFMVSVFAALLWNLGARSLCAMSLLANNLKRARGAAFK
jgi:hypothetical protein